MVIMLYNGIPFEYYMVYNVYNNKQGGKWNFLSVESSNRDRFERKCI